MGEAAITDELDNTWKEPVMAKSKQIYKIFLSDRTNHGLKTTFEPRTLTVYSNTDNYMTANLTTAASSGTTPFNEIH